MLETLLPLGLNLVQGVLGQNQQSKMQSQQNRMNALQSFLRPPPPIPQVSRPSQRMAVPNYSKPQNQKMATQRSLQNVNTRSSDQSDNTTLYIVAGAVAIGGLLLFMKKK
ncbi:hypothetical protein LEP1GSC079_1801 [Leptospira interrogans str. FPW1039]|uniref:Uncharacterized protein n=1 Tax=Leptospira interrogans str. FPW1039 TaxID=1193040 RepID=A0A0F6IIW7_LEPIR|nr:hypothetical protein [Leptospira interrogans]EMJ37992.1 hypothetical protein LEP1GSC079_1801 [Leptospira interrogans str. FPW1039]